MDEAISNIYHSFKGKYELATNSDDIFQYLQQQAKYLFAKKEDISRLIASQVAKRETHECATWLDDVNKIKWEFEDVKERYLSSRANGLRFANIPVIVKLSEEMKKKTEAIEFLKDRMKPDIILSIDHRFTVVEKKFAKELNDMNTYREVVEKLLGFLRDDSIKSIGIWGMAGVGKTTIMENLNDKVEAVEQHGMFDIVIWVTVSKGGSVRTIQQAIANRLNLEVDSNSSDCHLASLLRKSLEKKKYLVLLDDVFSEVDLRAVGILPSEHGKVVLATRYRLLCHSMDVDEDIRVERMSRGDARKLFRKVAGEAVEHPIIKPIAEQVLKECGELPQLIKVVARMLRNKFDEKRWLGILLKLQSPSDHKLQPMEEVQDVFKLVYDGLSDNLKHCLLYAASFPEDHEIWQDYLIECWKAEELIVNSHMFPKARQEGQNLLESLVEKYLFDRSKEEYVKMPFIFRKMALRIADADTNWLLLVKPDEKSEGYPPIEKWSGARVISLICSDLQCLPAKPDCSMLSTLFLQQNQRLTSIPPSFFDSMPFLKVLDVCGTEITSLPNSISNLANLRGLYLNNCRKLALLPKPIAELKKLEVLEICQTGLCGLPSDIGELTLLQCLKVSFVCCTHHETPHLDVIPSDTLRKLNLLQELTIDVDPLEIRWNRIAPVITKEVATLRMLSSLSFNFPSLKCFEDFITSSISWNSSYFPAIDDKFRSFKLTVGTHMANHLHQLDVSKCLAKRHLKYSDGKNISNAIKDVLKRVCVFEMVGHENVKNLTDFGVDNMECLEICIIEDCDTIQRIVAVDTPMAILFPWLKELHLLKLQQFETIWDVSILPGSFAKLNTLTLYDCEYVKKLLSSEMTKHLQELQYLRIEKCSQLTEIIADDRMPSLRVDSAGTLPSLKKLELIALPSLISISGDALVEWPALGRVEIIACERLTVLPFTCTNALRLQSIRCTEAWWEALVLEREVKAQLQKFCCFV